MNAEEAHILCNEHIIHEDFYGEFDVNAFHKSVFDDILDPVIDPNNLNMKRDRAPAGQQGLPRMVVVDP